MYVSEKVGKVFFLFAHVTLHIRTVILVPDLPTKSQNTRQTFETKDFSIWELYIERYYVYKKVQAQLVLPYVVKVKKFY